MLNRRKRKSKLFQAFSQPNESKCTYAGSEKKAKWGLILSCFFEKNVVVKIMRAAVNHENLRICKLRTGTPKKFADFLGKRNQPQEFADLRFADFKKKFACPLLLSTIP